MLHSAQSNKKYKNLDKVSCTIVLFIYYINMPKIHFKFHLVREEAGILHNEKKVKRKLGLLPVTPSHPQFVNDLQALLIEIFNLGVLYMLPERPLSAQMNLCLPCEHWREPFKGHKWKH